METVRAALEHNVQNTTHAMAVFSGVVFRVHLEFTDRIHGGKNGDARIALHRRMSGRHAVNHVFHQTGARSIDRITDRVVIIPNRARYARSEVDERKHIAGIEREIQNGPIVDH